MLWDRVWSPDLPSCCPGCIQPCKAPSGGNSGESPAQGQAFCRTTLFPVTSAKLPPGSHSAGPCAPTRPQGRRHPALVLLQGLAVPVLRPSGCEGARSRPRAVESPQHLRARVLKCGARALRCETQPESRPPAPMVSPDPPAPTVLTGLSASIPTATSNAEPSRPQPPQRQPQPRPTHGLTPALTNRRADSRPTPTLIGWELRAVGGLRHVMWSHVRAGQGRGATGSHPASGRVRVALRYAARHCSVCIYCMALHC